MSQWGGGLVFRGLGTRLVWDTALFPRYRLLDEYPSEPYTDVYWIKYVTINSARVAKRKIDNRSFFGKPLHVCYAPEYEGVEETREKLQLRRKVISQKTKGSHSGD